MSEQTLIHMEKVSHTYGTGDSSVLALREITWSVNEGEFLAITGPSGSGKSTLMHIAGCLQRPTAGSYWLEGIEVSRHSSNHLASIRNETFGFVFQMFCLLPRFTALQNVALPLIYAGVGRRKRNTRARKLLSELGLGDRMSHYPGQLSGGEQQRVAMARALANNPRILFADEPTGNLDTATGSGIMELLEKYVRSEGMTVVYVSHDPLQVQRASRVISLRDSHIVQNLS